jgi:peptidoglycan-N-acetylglucosamine deacetylase
VSFTFDFDAESVWHGRDPGVVSMGTYGAKVALPLILELLRRLSVPATFFVPGVVAERYPQRVRAIVASGHELAAHGYTHRSRTRLSRVEEAEELTSARKVLKRFGTGIRGYRSPGWEFSANTLDLLEEHGFAYSSNLMDDIRPYRHPGRSIVELPVHWLLDDAAHWWLDPAAPAMMIPKTADVAAIWKEELNGIRSLGGLCVFTMHPQIIGRPSRLSFLERIVEHVKSLEDVWIAPCRDVADRIR